MTHDKAQRAIYIDFESLKTTTASPSLLGVLEGDVLEQHILDAVLAPAGPARPHSRVTALADAVDAIVARTRESDSAIVGWSLFDRDVVERSELPAGLKAAFKARYVNGRALASRWKSTLHPKVKIERDDRFDPRNRLDRFALLAAYPHAGKLSGKPAKWIRHVRQQLIATGGRYRCVTQEAKRDWRRLLDYNADDCKALRHIVLRAAYELEKWREYELTNYCVFDSPRAFCFRVGSTSRRLDALLEREGANRWAFMTAWNPGSEPMSDSQNAARQKLLLAALAEYATIPAEGVGRDVTWPPEPSLLVLGITRREAVLFGRDFGQLAVVVGHRGFPARLVACSQMANGKWQMVKGAASPSDADPQVPCVGRTAPIGGVGSDEERARGKHSTAELQEEGEPMRDATRYEQQPVNGRCARDGNGRRRQRSRAGKRDRR